MGHETARATHRILALHLSFFAALRCACQRDEPLILNTPSAIVTCRCGRTYGVTKMQHEITDGRPNTAIEISEVTTLHRPALSICQEQ